MHFTKLSSRSTVLIGETFINCLAVHGRRNLKHDIHKHVKSIYIIIIIIIMHTNYL